LLLKPERFAVLDWDELGRFAPAALREQLPPDGAYVGSDRRVGHDLPADPGEEYGAVALAELDRDVADGFREALRPSACVAGLTLAKTLAGDAAFGWKAVVFNAPRHEVSVERRS